MKAIVFTKKIAVLILTVVMASVLAASAFAAVAEPGIRPMASGNGWSSTSIVKNGVSYTLNAGAGIYSSTNSGYTALETTCNCTRTHGIVTMVYLAEGDGYITVKSSRSRTHTDVTGVTESYKASPSSSYGAYQSFRSISGTITVTVTNQDGSTASATLSPKATNS